MLLKDRIAVAGWLRSNCSMHEVDRIPCVGLVGNERFTPRAKRTFELLWEWGAYRFSSTKQERWYQLFGSAGVERRMERARSLARAIAGRADTAHLEAVIPGTGQTSLTKEAT